ncbi:hypothetical protein [Streptomyces geysiriensis]|uniref:hypothetical protein n=1 Tax=Streptomyces geysiriensis TaxID=68207 RepID=UPI001C7DAF4C|nr:hypothetical protein [Streptomyces geysiriensis]MBX4176438.1 hypothetical protein [Streptomyces geysiriensis]
MTDTARLTARQTNRLITALRHGQALDLAAADLGLSLTTVWATARTDTRLTIALAGRDPDAPEEHGRTLRADFLRLLALGVPPSRAELILGSTSFSGWRGDDPAFAQACDAVSDSAAPYGHTGQIRLTPARVARFLEALGKQKATLVAAAAAAGVTPAAIYQRRRRDEAFAKAMDEARAMARSRSGQRG